MPSLFTWQPHSSAMLVSGFLKQPAWVCLCLCQSRQSRARQVCGIVKSLPRNRNAGSAGGRGQGHVLGIS